jgi:hypothetical protein
MAFSVDRHRELCRDVPFGKWLLATLDRFLNDRPKLIRDLAALEQRQMSIPPMLDLFALRKNMSRGQIAAPKF